MDNPTLEAFQRLSGILDTLRRECPWDSEQTMASLRYLTIEEVHELSEAIVRIENSKLKIENPPDASHLSPFTSHLKKELGDLAMHILFYCKLAEDEGLFTTADVYNTICDKLVDRHPFIYHKDHYHGESWEQLKMREDDRKGVLDGVPDSLPSLVKAIRMQEKVAGMGLTPLGGAGGDQAPLPPSPLGAGTTGEQFGDYLFALVDWARRHGINADDALCGANYRFRQKYAAVDG